ncbi:hypothetical protein [Alcanivorax sp.]|jgi:hypothetical protein|uniref:hypothetical protein n=1 Tax=Alcanivorax sp. TaxID=1872427 RepID=UPI0032D95B30
MSKILTLHKKRPNTALKNLNRLTGLDFQRWPESLMDSGTTTVSTRNSEDTGRPAIVPQRISRQG